MREQDLQVSSLKETNPPWWVRLCHRFWKIASFLGVSVVLSSLVNVFSTWFTSSKGIIPIDSPFGRLLAQWPLTLLIGSCLLLIALLMKVASQWPNYSIQSTLAMQNRTRMLRRLRRTYEDLLTQSLQDVAIIELGFSQKYDAIQNAASLLLRYSSMAERLLPLDTSILLVYEEAGHELLILGEPGAGKSTLLLNLAQQLVERAKQDNTQPLPIILPLSSWAESRLPLQDWLAEQITQVYDIPRQLAKRWLQDKQIMPLLDGLDEMDEQARPACIAAINGYHHTQMGPIVVCSRNVEYDEAAKRQRLVLQCAVVVLPLSYEQVDSYLAKSSMQLEALHRAFKKNIALQELASTPLMLSILILTYHGTSVRGLSKKEAALQQQVWTNYVQRMTEQKGKAKRYSLERTCSWLHWLAKQMRAHNQATFYLEYLQPDWLSVSKQRSYQWMAVYLPAIMIGILVTLLVQEFLQLNPYGLTDLASLFQYSVLGGFVGGLWSASLPDGNILAPQKRTFRTVWSTRLAVSIFIGLLLSLSSGLFFAVGAGFGCLLLQYFFALPRRTRSSSVPTHHWLGIIRLLRTVQIQQGLLVTVIFGLIAGFDSTLYGWLEEGRYFRLTDALIFGLNGGLSKGLSYGLISALVGLVLQAPARDIRLKERLQWTWGSLKGSLLALEHLRTTLFLACPIMVLIGLGEGWIAATASGMKPQGDILFTFNLDLGLSKGLSTGLSTGLSIGLSYWLLVGLFRGINQKAIEDHDRLMANQGIQRSLSNSVNMSVISGCVIVVIGVFSFMLNTLGIGLSTWLNFNLIYRLDGVITAESSDYLSIRIIHILMNDILVIGVSGAFLVCLLSGGLAVWQHYIIRLLLKCSQSFPWQAVSFLDDATARILLKRVGGGYSFTHRLLLDYFAALEAEAQLAATVQTKVGLPLEDIDGELKI